MKTAALVLGSLVVFAAMLARLATLPFLPGYLAKGATAPTDESEVIAASELLKSIGAALFFTAIIVERVPPTLLNMCACAALAFTTYRAWDVIVIIIAWAAHVRGKHAMMYWVTLITTPFLALLAIVAIMPGLL